MREASRGPGFLRGLVLAGSLLLAAPPAEPARSAIAERSVEVVSVDLVGRQTTLTHDAAVAVAPSVGRDGRIAFVSTRDGSDDVYVMDADGGNVRRLTTWSGASASLDTLDLSQTAWSPREDAIAFDGLYAAVQSPPCPQHCANWRVVTVGAGGGELKQVAVDARAPAWSQDGGRLAYESDLDSYFVARSITISRLDGSGAVHVKGWNGDSAVGPVWLPRGGEIAFQASRAEGGTPWICTVTRDGARLRRLAPGHNPTWSPDGRHLAFVRDHKLMVIARDGTGLRRLSPKSEFVVASVWSPHGGTIAYIAGTSLPRFGGLPRNLRLETVTADGRRIRVLVRGLTQSWVSGVPAWAPDGKRIVVALMSQ